MKKLIATSLLILLVAVAFAQRVIEYPEYGIGTTAVTITKIELTNNETALTFKINLEPGRNFGIANKSYIQIVGESDSLFMTRKDAPEPVNGWITVPEEGLSYILYFPAIDPKTEKIDFGEPSSSPWMIYDIIINKPPYSSALPEEFSGHWFSAGTGEWKYSFFEKNAIADEKVWEYASVKNEKQTWKIVLKSDKEEKIIFAKSENNKCYFGNNPASLKASYPEFTGINISENKNFATSVINPSEVKYSGFIRNFSERLGINSGLVTVMNVITRETNKYVISIRNDGYFSVNFPLDLPQMVLVSLPKQSTQLFFEPGKNLFHLSNSGIPEQPSLFMGGNARMNYDLENLPRLNINSPDVLESVQKMDFETYVNFVQKEKEKLVRTFENKKNISAKARELGFMDIQFQYAYELLRFNQNKRLGTYYINRNLKEEEQIPYTEEKIDFEDFRRLLKGTPLNKDIALISGSFNTLLSTLRYTDIELGQSAYYTKMQSLKNRLVNEGLELTAEEAEMFEFIRLNFVENNNVEESRNFSRLYIEPWNKFRQKYTEVIQEYMNEYYYENLKKNLKNIFDTESGLAVELPAVQNYYQPTINKAELPDLQAFNQIKKMIKNPALKEYVISDYYKKKAEYELISRGGEAVVKTEGDKIFDNIIINYKGKVVYVDFWATWCGPCRAGIEKIKPLKEALKNEDIVFVYITNPTSPDKDYAKMKPDIKGEHYKLTADEWNHLAAKFNIFGIPHYALVDKNGKIVNKHLLHYENDELKKVLLEQVNK